MERAVDWLSGNQVSGPGGALYWFLPVRNLGAQGGGGSQGLCQESKKHLGNEQLPHKIVATSTAHMLNVCEYCLPFTPI